MAKDKDPAGAGKGGDAEGKGRGEGGDRKGRAEGDAGGKGRPEGKGGKGRPDEDRGGDSKRKGGVGEGAAEGQAPAEGAAAGEGAPKPKKKAKARVEGEGGPKRRGRAMRGWSRRHRESLKKVDEKKQYQLEEGVKLLKEMTKGTKFVQTINLVMHLGIDPKHADQMVRGAISLPKGIGKTKRVIAFVEGEEATAAKAAGAIEVGVDDLIKKVNDGWADFDVAIAHPRNMGKVGRLGRVLGPQGKMPSPKNGTVTNDIQQAVKEFAAGKIEFRNDTGGNIHAVVGKADFSDSDLSANIHAFIDHIRRAKPQSSKGTYIRKVCISGTMSPAVEIHVAQ